MKITKEHIEQLVEDINNKISHEENTEICWSTFKGSNKYDLFMKQNEQVFEIERDVAITKCYQILKGILFGYTKFTIYQN